jgi:hypothetical protein
VNAAEKAAKLAHVTAIESLEHPVYFQQTARWDRVGTIAGVFAATIILRNRLSPEEFNVAEQSLNTAVNRFPFGQEALGDCTTFVMERASDGGALDTKMLPLVLGMWLLWNTRGDQPPQAEMPAAFVAGKVLFECMEEALSIGEET